MKGENFYNDDVQTYKLTDDGEIVPDGKPEKAKGILPPTPHLQPPPSSEKTKNSAKSGMPCGCVAFLLVIFVIVFVAIASTVFQTFNAALGGGTPVEVTGYVDGDVITNVSGSGSSTSTQYFIWIRSEEQPEYNEMLFQLANINQLGRVGDGDYVRLEGRVVTVAGVTGVLVDQIEVLGAVPR